MIKNDLVLFPNPPIGKGNDLENYFSLPIRGLVRRGEKYKILNFKLKIEFKN
jgi:hypothetical protein